MRSKKFISDTFNSMQSLFIVYNAHNVQCVHQIVIDVFRKDIFKLNLSFVEIYSKLTISCLFFFNSDSIK
jgi:uncharacterized HAD superfamily protein